MSASSPVALKDTHGLPKVVRAKGSYLWDTSGKQYIDGLAPDESFPAATESMQTSSDPVVQAALDWLSLFGHGKPEY